MSWRKLDRLLLCDSDCLFLALHEQMGPNQITDIPGRIDRAEPHGFLEQDDHFVRSVAEERDVGGNRSAGARRLFLPAYSPDLNLKALLRRARARTFDAVSDAITQLLDEFSAQECANYIRNSGYASI